MGLARRRWRTGWQGLGSTRLAALLLAAVLLASLLASLFPQMPADPAARQAWLTATALRYGNATDLLRTVGLFDVGHALWFLALLGALLLNTLACTLQRLPCLWRSFRKGHRAQAGTLIGHAAALGLVAALAARPALAWRETGLRLLPGLAQPVGHGTELAAQAGELTIDSYPDGRLRDYQVPLTILANGSPLKSQMVRPKGPLTCRGLSFHLQSYGPAAQVTAPEGSFVLAFADNQGQELALPQAGLRLRIAPQPNEGRLFIEALATGGTPLGSGTVTDGQQIELHGVPLTFHLRHYTVWQVSHDPTFALAVGSAGLLLVAMTVSLWVRRPSKGSQLSESMTGEDDG